MPRRSGLALSLACAATALCSAEAAAPAAEYLGTYSWSMDDARFGGFSGLEIAEDGLDFTALTDRGTLATGRLVRDAAGRITGIEDARLVPVLDPDGRPVTGGGADPEGLAIAADGRIYVSFEARHRVWAYAAPGAPAEAFAQHPAFRRFQPNSGMEALAIDAAGWLYTLPERSGDIDRPFPVYRYDGEWSQPFTLPRDGTFLPVGADFGPDGRLYLLERDFRGLFGFYARVSRFEIGGEGAGPREVIYETAAPFQNNFEGISVWSGGDGSIRMTLISDDNFTGVLTTEFQDFRLAD